MLSKIDNSLAAFFRSKTIETYLTIVTVAISTMFMALIMVWFFYQLRVIASSVGM